MDKKVIDYLVVRMNSYGCTSHHNKTYKEKKELSLSIALQLKNTENEILMYENEKILLDEESKYYNELISKVDDFASYKVSRDDIDFYLSKYGNSHPLDKFRYGANYKKELNEEVIKFSEKVNEKNNKIFTLKSKIQKLGITKKALLESNKTLDLETYTSHFENSVMHYIEKGYVPQGGISVSNDIYHQAMVKYEE